MTTSKSENARNVRVGLLVTAATIALLIFLFFIGSEQKLFAKKYDYEVRFPSAQGLAEGNPVHMTGVNIGVVKEIRLPRRATERFVEITVSIDRKFAERIREDSRARVKKLGLIAADSYVDIVPGSPDSPVLKRGSDIPAARQANVDELLGQGEDLVDNFVSISASLRNVLERVDRGEGLLGELTSSPESKQKVTDTFMVTLTKINTVLEDVERGRGIVGRLVADDAYAEQVLSSLGQTASSVQRIAASIEVGFETGEGTIPALMNDPEQKDKVVALIGNLEVVSKRLVTLSEGFEGKGGMLPRLIKDEPYADKTLAEFQSLVSRLNAVSKQLAEGHGAAGRLIQDPAIYESVNDILIGINESKMLRWLIRRSQAKGIERRYRAERTSAGAEEQPAPAIPITPEEPAPAPDESAIDAVNELPPATSTVVEPGPPVSPPSEPPAEDPAAEAPAAEEPPAEEPPPQVPPPPPGA
ncbi:MAG: MCE family protein [Acidobacteria bacterium]|nr:MCE family protein [Acidobacteriota bacterium]